jgi:deoxycytidylate deaminase
VKKNLSAWDLARDLTARSVCNVRVAAVITDGHGVIGWSWNHAGRDGYGECAEIGALRRSNRKRLAGAVLTVVAIRAKTGRQITSRPCVDCEKAITKAGIMVVRYLNERGLRVTEFRGKA